MTLSIAADTTSSLPKRSALRRQVNWKLSVADNRMASLLKLKTGLGTSIVKALAHQLGAQVETLAGSAKVFVLRSAHSSSPPTKMFD
jgi:hypothetical protein